MADKRRQQGFSSTENEQNMSNNASSGQSPGVNKFANDGSFMEMFRKRMEEANKQKSSSTTESEDNASSSSHSTDPSFSSSSTRTDLSAVDTSPATPQKDTITALPKKPSVLSFVGKRRGGRVLKTGAVKKVRNEDDESSEKKDAWSQYLDEVKKYKSKMCGDEDKTRPLVK